MISHGGQLIHWPALLQEAGTVLHLATYPKGILYGYVSYQQLGVANTSLAPRQHLPTGTSCVYVGT